MASNEPVATATAATERVGPSRPDAVAAATASLAVDPSSLAILLDFDGTLAPIVDDPASAAPDAAAAEAARSLAGRVALLACVTGRPALQARGLLGVEGIAYTGLHGAEVLQPGADAPDVPEAFAADGAAVAAIVQAARAEPEGLAGLDVEEKGPIVALHWRRATDPVTAQARAEELAARAVAAGLRSGTGRAVIELRPALELTKGDGVEALLRAAPCARHAVFAGDDVTDLDAFARLRTLVADGTLDDATLIAVGGPDAPPQVAAAADLVLSTPGDLGALLADLAIRLTASASDRSKGA